MKFNALNRRHFLRGLGGTALSLPFLPSLMPKAMAQVSNAKYFVCMSSQHGGVDVGNMYPSANLTHSSGLYSYLDHQMRWEPLNNLLSTQANIFNPNGNAELSPVLSQALNPYLDRVNLIRGLDFMFGGGHQAGGYLGNFHGNDSRNFDSGVDKRMLLEPIPTIDQVMAYSPNFYGANDPVAARTMNISPSRIISFTQQGSQVHPQEPLGWGHASALFDSMFSSNPEQTINQTRLIDRVIEDYRRLTQSAYGPGRRLSSEDRLRLEGFVSQMDDLETRLNNRAQSCAIPHDRITAEFEYNDTDLNNLASDWSAYLDVVMLGFQCGRSRIATISIANTSDFTGDWHQSVAHQHLEEEPQRLLTLAHRWITENIYVPLLDRLNTDAGEGDGQTYLDKSVVVWQHECGPYTHDGISLPTLMAGNVGGFFNTGYFVDYRNQNNLGASRWWSELRPGLPQNRWLNSLLLSMGIQEQEFRRADMPGYGDPYQDPGVASYEGHTSWSSQMVADCNLAMPLIVA